MAKSKRVSFSGQTRKNNPTYLVKVKSPLEISTDTARTAFVTLASSFQVHLSYLEAFLVENVQCYNELKMKLSTLDKIEASSLPPRSLWFKFELNGPADLLRSTKAKALQEQCLAPIAACQATLKANIIKLRQLKIKEIKKKQSIACFKFVCYLARTFQVIKELYNKCDLTKVITPALQTFTGTTLFIGLSEDEIKYMLLTELPSEPLAPFEIIEEESKNEEKMEDVDVEAIDLDMNITRLEFIHELESAITNCLLKPLQTYDQHVIDTDKVSKLKALEVAATTRFATEQTVIELDNEPTVSTTLLNSIIDQKIKAESKKIQAALKNNLRGAPSHTSLNKNTGTTVTNGGKHSGRSARKKENSKEKPTTLLLKSPKYSDPQAKPKAKPKGKQQPPQKAHANAQSKEDPAVKNNDSKDDKEANSTANKNKRKRKPLSNTTRKPTKKNKTS